MLTLERRRETVNQDDFKDIKHPLLFGQSNGPFNHVFQLSYISGPVIRSEHINGG